MSMPLRYILQRINDDPLSQVNEKPAAEQISARLSKHASMPPASSQDDFWVARERLAQELAKEVNATCPVPAGGRRAPRLNTRHNYLWWGLAGATFSAALASLAGYAFLTQGGAGLGGATQREESEASNDGLEADPVTATAAVARIYTPGEERNGLAEAKPEGAAPPEEKPDAKLAPQIEDSGPLEVAAPVRTVSSLSKATEDALLQRALHQLKLEDISGARRIYEVLALQGSQQGAFGLAETYDAKFLARHHVIGLKPDLRLARQWYEKAASLGSLEAAERLRTLD